MRIKWIIAGFLVFIANWLHSQNAPVTSAPVVGNALTGQPVSASVKMKNFVDIGAFRLTLNYENSVLLFQSLLFNPVFTGLTCNSSTPGKIIISWTGSEGITLPDQAELLSINFSYISGTSKLSWDTTESLCEFKKYANGSFSVLNDSPKISFYKNGVISSRLSPQTIAPVITDASPGTLYLPVTVNNFSGIGSLYLMFTYDVGVLTYQNVFTPNPVFTSNFLVGSSNGPPGKKILIISWYGNPATLPDESILVTLKFTYSNTSVNGNYSLLSWYDCGPCCEYTDATSTVLYDYPTGDFYSDGLVTNQVSPVTWMPLTSNATPGNTISVPVLVRDFNNICGLFLAFKYDPAVMTLPADSYTPNPIFNGTLQINNLPPGDDGKRTVILSRNGSSLSLPDGSSIVNLNFYYLSGSSPLTWITAQDSCHYTDVYQHQFWKSPPSDYFQDGLVTSHKAPNTKIGAKTGINGQPVLVPVSVDNFNNIGFFTLTLHYDPGVLQYQAASLVPPIGGAFTSTLTQPGQIVMEWSGSSVSVPDGENLINLTFVYLGGSTSLQWYCEGSSCQFKEGLSLMPLYDFPKTSYYENGSLFPDRTCTLSLFLEGLYAGEISGVKTMNQAKDVVMGVNVPRWPDGVADHITVELHSTPYLSSVVYTATDIPLSTTGVAIITGVAVTSGQFYITIKHRNSIETTSANRVDFSGTIINYTFNEQSKAYGNNLGIMTDGTTVIYAGDVNQDGIIDGSDMNDIGNKNDLFASGYMAEDINGDGLIDGSDMNIAGNNNDAFVLKKTP